MRHIATRTSWLYLLLVGCTYAVAQTNDPVRAQIAEITEKYQNLWRVGQYEEALDLLNRETETYSEYAPDAWFFDRVELKFQLGMVDEAINETEWMVFRRATPALMLQAARYYRARGRTPEAENTLARAQRRFARRDRYERTIENDLALLRIRELNGENPRVLFREILEGDDDESEADRVRRLIAAGELALRKYDYQLSAEQFEQALAIDPLQIDAQAGLAECFWRSLDPRLEETLEKTLAVNPRHFRALSVRVEMALDGRRPESALRDIETALSVNPRHLRFLSLKAAALFLLDREEEMAELQQRALEFNPKGSDVFRIPGRVASRAYRFAEAAELQRRALEANPEDNRARTLLAFDLLRMGQDEEGRALLRESFEQDRFNVQAYNMLELMDKLDEFAEIERGPFVLKMPPAEAPVWADEALALLQRGHDALSKKYRMSPETPVYVQIFDNHDDFMVRSVGLPGSVGHLGICFGRLVTMDSPSARSRWAMNWQSVLWHEFVHVITLQKTRNRIPRWLSEGISVYEETVADPSWGQRLAPAYRLVAAEEPLPGVDDLEKFFTEPQSQMHLMFGYFLAGEFVGHYVDAYGFDALLAALDGIAAKKECKAALTEAAGVTGVQLDVAFREFQRARYAAFENLPPLQPSFMDKMLGGVAEKIGLSGGSPFADAMKEGREAFESKDWERAEKALLEARRLYPEYTGEDGPLPLLIQLYRERGQREALIGALRDAAALDPANVPAFQALGELAVESRDWSRAAEAAKSVLAVDPFDVPARRDLWRALAELNRIDEALTALDRLIRLDPNRAAEYRLHRVDALVGDGRRSQAKTEIIRLLEDTPYSWDAQRRLLELVEESAEGGGREAP